MQFYIIQELYGSRYVTQVGEIGWGWSENIFDANWFTREDADQFVAEFKGTWLILEIFDN